MTSRPERRWNSRLDMCKTKEKSDEVMRKISLLNHVLLQGSAQGGLSLGGE